MPRLLKGFVQHDPRAQAAHGDHEAADLPSWVGCLDELIGRQLHLVGMVFAERGSAWWREQAAAAGGMLSPLAMVHWLKQSTAALRVTVEATGVEQRKGGRAGPSKQHGRTAVLVHPRGRSARPALCCSWGAQGYCL